MRLRSVAASAAAVLLIALTPPAHAAVKAGAACTKIGASRVVSGVKYTCIKSGKRLVWNKGARITPAALPTAAPTPRPTPTPTPAPTTTQSTPQPLPPTALERWRALPTSAVAIWAKWKPAADVLGAKSHTIPMTFTFNDAVPQNIRDEVRRQYLISGAFWDQYLDVTRNTEIIWGVSGQITWVCTERARYFDNSPGAIDGCASWNDSSSLAAYTPVGADTINWYLFDRFEDFQNRMWRPRLHHEFVHSVFFFAGNPRHWFTNACWFEEGAAEWFGVLLQSEGDEERWVEARTAMLSINALESGRFASSSTAQDWADWLTKTSGPKQGPFPGDGCQPFNRDGIYQTAALAVEYLVREVGIPGFIEFQRQVGRVGWEQALEATFGKSMKEVYLAMGEYMRTEYRLVADNGGWLPRICEDGRPPGDHRC